MLLTNNTKYHIMNVEHYVRDDLIIKDPIPMTDSNILNDLYTVIKYTTEFLENNNIDYCIESGTLLGSVRHGGIIPWDNDMDIMILRDGYNKLKKIMNLFNKDKFNILNIIPGFKVFYKNIAFGEIFVYDMDNDNKIKLAYPYINDKPTFLASKLYFPRQKFNINDIIPTKKIKFEDFMIRVPNNIAAILNTTYRGNLLECRYYPVHHNQHMILEYKHYKIYSYLEKILLNKIFYFVYYLLHFLISKKIFIFE